MTSICGHSGRWARSKLVMTIGPVPWGLDREVILDDHQSCTGQAWRGGADLAQDPCPVPKYTSGTYTPGTRP